MTSDYYKDAARIAELLRREGERDVAEQVIGIIEGGATASEILMGIRFHLRNAVDAGKTGGDVSTARVRSLVAEIDEALNG